MSVAAAVLLGALAGVALSALFVIRERRVRSRQVERITEYLESAALGKAGVLLPTGEDDLSRLQDEIGKTVTALHHARIQAVRAKDDFAQNLSNIAHQIKTPISVISLAVQHIDDRDQAAVDRATQTIIAQTARLEKLQEDLLLMAKLDAGVLKTTLEKQDVFTLLTIAADNVEDLAESAGVAIEVVGNSPVEVVADEHWMCEALMNVMNCIEHSPAGATVRVAYNSNPLYAEIQIADEGQGFEPAEEGRLFERFFTGKRSASGATGLGLAFARELLELQNGSMWQGRCRRGHLVAQRFCQKSRACRTSLERPAVRVGLSAAGSWRVIR